MTTNPSTSLKKKHYFMHIARNSHFQCLSINDWDMRLSELQTRRNHRKTIKGPQGHRFWNLQCWAWLNCWVPTGLKKLVKWSLSMLPL